MAFNSLAYLVFLPVVLAVYSAVRETRRPLVLLVASGLFYAALGAPELVAALAVVCVVTFAAGGRIADAGTSPRSRWLLWGSIGVNLGVLLVLRYLGPLADGLRSVFGGTPAGAWPFGRTLASIGVSFYSFQAISYLLDVYVGATDAEREFVPFALYVSFFPKLLQGPIERGASLLPQLRDLQPVTYENLRAGLFLFAWGLFKKIVVADRLALFTDAVFGNVGAFRGPSLLLAVLLYSVQIYADFAGYTDMALGSARVFGLSLTRNFDRPYAATSVMEFWRRWHISLSRWLFDYLFKPLQMAFRGRPAAGTAAALLLTFLASGAWHGAAWHFVLWGALHGLYTASSVLTRSVRTRITKAVGLDPKRLRVIRIAWTFSLVAAAWVFFRANTVSDAAYVLCNIWSGWMARTGPVKHALLLDQPVAEAAIAMLGLGVFASAGLAKKRLEVPTTDDFLVRSGAGVRYVAFAALLYAILLFPAPGARAFIYFQF
jgi:alginate O-acetyltransferase complex protein AlgI